MRSLKHLSNVWVLGAAILIVAAFASLIAPDGLGPGPAPVEAKATHAARHHTIGSGYGVMRFRPAATEPTTSAAPETPAPATQPEPETNPAPQTQPAAATQPATQPPSPPAAPPIAPPATPPTSQSSELSPAIAPTALATAAQPQTSRPSSDETPATTAPASTEPATAASAPASDDSAAAAPDDTDQHATDRWLADQRGKLADKGIVIDALLATWVGQNFMGGTTDSHGGASYEFNLNFTFDSKKLLGYDGGSLFVNFRTEDGLENSLDGSFGSTSHLDSPQLTDVSELWYQQTLFDSKLRLKAGKIDANADFGAVQNGGNFLNDFAAFSATIVGFPTDPDPALGAEGFYTLNDHISLGVGAFDGSLQQGVPTGGLGTQTGFHSLFLIAEGDATWSFPGGRDGRFGAGIWRHTGSNAHLDDDGHDNSVIGPYATLDQTLWRVNPDKDDDKRGVALFAIAGYANPRVSPVAVQYSAGLQYTGLIPTRPDDVAGLGAGVLRFTRADAAGFDHNSETTVETFYKIQLKPWLSVQPDLQYINDPGGISSQHNALIGTIQFLMDF